MTMKSAMGGMLLCMFACLDACTNVPPPRTVYQDVRTAVQLRVDPQAGTGHSHPAHLQVEQMVRILSGIRVQPDRRTAYRILAGEAETVPAFTAAEALALAPHLAKALSAAKPDELVTFYRRISDSSTGLAYTTGGLFMREGHLYLVLANYRQSPSDAMSLGIPAYEIDPYDTPLMSLKRAGYTVTFVPQEAEVHPVDNQWKWEFPDRGKLIVIDPLLVFRSSGSSSSKNPTDPKPVR